MLKKFSFLIVVSCLVVLSSFFVKEVQAYTFSRNLQIGDNSTDVIELQKILNTSTDTMVAVYGPGSPGKETASFGALTKKAVIRFQNKYRSEILTPAGLTFGTGYVGASTRNKLNSSQRSVQTPNVPPTPSNPIVSSSSLVGITPVLSLYSFSELKTAPGRTITLIGTGFDALSNTVHIGNSIIKDLPSDSTKSHITLTIPSSIPYGTHHIWVVTPTGSTENSKLQTQIIIGAVAIAKAKVMTISPLVVGSNDTITITGSGFTSNNSVITSLGKIDGIASSDGKTLTFITSKLSNFSKIPASVKKTLVRGTIANENGSAINGFQYTLNK